jgi:hypothetical protein
MGDVFLLVLLFAVVGTLYFGRQQFWLKPALGIEMIVTMVMIVANAGAPSVHFEALFGITVLWVILIANADQVCYWLFGKKNGTV